MKEDIISVIVPVYNVEKYLQKCVYSILNQTYKNLEIILVDDGSTDNSGSICDNFSKKNNKIKVIHKRNGGLSDARNIGIKASKGRYLAFVDSDDFISKEMIEKLYYSCINNNSEISSCAKSLEYQKNKIIINNNKEFCIPSNLALEKMFIGEDIDNSVCDKLFKRELFNNIDFPVGRYYEDIATTYKLILKSKNISHICYVGYHYVIRNNSISTEKFSNKQLDALFFSRQAMEETIKKYPELKMEAESYYFLELMTTLRKIKRALNKNDYKIEYKKIKTEYNKNLNKILKNKFIPIYKKIMGICIYFNLYEVVEIIYKIKTKKK